MPLYKHEGKYYNIDTNDHSVAKQKIQAHLQKQQQQEAPKTDTSLFEKVTSPDIMGVGPQSGMALFNDALRGLEGAYKGLSYPLRGKGSFLDAADVMQKHMEQNRYIPSDPDQKKTYENILSGLDWMQQKVGEGAVNTASRTPPGILANMAGVFPENYLRTSAELGFNLGLGESAVLAAARKPPVRPRPNADVPPPSPDVWLHERAKAIAEGRGHSTITRDDVIAAQNQLSGKNMPTEQIPTDTAASYRPGELEDVWRQNAQNELSGMMQDDMRLREEQTGIRDLFDERTEPTLSEPYRSARERLTDDPRGDVYHRDPIALDPSREAPEGAYQPGDTVPYQPDLLLPESEQFRMQSQEFNVADGTPPAPGIRQMGDVPFYPRPDDVLENNQPDLFPSTVRPDTLEAVKEPGGMWHPEAVERLTNALVGDRVELAMYRRGNTDDVALAALPYVQWSENAVKRYLNKYAGTTRDPLKDVEIPFGDGTKRWEEFTDKILSSERVGFLQEVDKRLGRVGADYGLPNLERASPDEQLWNTRATSDERGYFRANNGGLGAPAINALSSYLTHVGDYLRQHVPPEKLQQYDLVRAVKETAKWDADMAKKAKHEQGERYNKLFKDATIHKEYPDGMRWVKLDRPGQFADESTQLGHSVRGYEPYNYSRDPITDKVDPAVRHPDWIQDSEYGSPPGMSSSGHPNYGLGGWDAIKRGDAEIYSLRDKEGNAAVTIEVNANPTGLTKGYPRTIDEDAPRILQIKGKGNRAPAEKYLPYVQDFVKSREWGHVGDVQNTGMRALTEYLLEDTGGLGLVNKLGVDNVSKAAKEWFAKDKAPDSEWGTTLVTKQEWEAFLDNYVNRGRTHEVSKRIAEAFDEKAVPINEEYNAKLAERVLAGDFRGSLELIQTTSPSGFARWLADVLAIDENFNPKLVVYSIIKTGDTFNPGQFSPKRREIRMSKTGGWHGSEWAFLHEAVHARVVELQWRLEAGISLPANVKRHLQGLRELYDYVQKTAPHLADEYGMKDIYEFMAEGLTNKEFRDALKEVKVPHEVFSINMEKGVWSALKGFIHNIISILKNEGMRFNPRTPDAFLVFLNESGEVLRQVGFDPEVAKIAYGPEGMAWASKINADFNAISPQKKKQEPSIMLKGKSEFRRDLVASDGEGFADKWADTLYHEYKKQWKLDNMKRPAQIGWDNRNLDELKQDLFRPDGTRRVDDAHLAPFGPSYTMAESDNPVIRYTFDQIAQANVQRDNLFNKWYRRESIEKVKINPLKGKVTGMQGVARKDHSDSLSVLMKEANTNEQKQVMEIAERYQYTNPEYLSDTDMLRANGATPRVVKLFLEFERVAKEMLSELNKALTAMGKDPIEYRPGYLWSHVRYGKYQIALRDKQDRHLYLHGTNDFAEAETIAEYLRSNKGMEVEIQYADYNPRTITFMPTEAYFQASTLIRDPEAKKIFREAVDEAISKAGVAGRHRLARDSQIGGYAGSPEIVQALGVDKAWEGVQRSVNTYLRQAANFVGNHEAAKKVGAMLIDDDIKRQYPNALSKAKYMWENYQGNMHALNQGLEKISAWLFSKPVLKYLGDARTGNTFLANTANIAISSHLVWLNPAFYLANGGQNFVVPSRLQQLQSTVFEGKGNISEALLRAEMHMHMPTDVSKEIFHRALENGSLEARFAEALDWSTKEGTLPKTAKFLLGEHMAAFADSYSRGKAYVSFYEFARSAGLDSEKAHGFAARESQGTMVIYDRWARMPVLNALGPVGDAIAPLTTYISNMVFRLADYMKHAAVGKDGQRLIAPLGTLLGLQLAIAGIRGMPFYEDLEDMYMWLNAENVRKGGERWPTPSEWMARMGIPSVAQVGIPSRLVGTDMSGTMGSGRVLGNIGNVFGLENAWNLVSGFFEAAQNTMTGHMDTNDKIAATNKISPALLKEPFRAFLERRDPREPALGMVGDKMVHKRTEREQLGALLTGKTPIAEAEAKRAYRHGNALEAATSEAKAQARDLLVDTLILGKPLSPMVTKVFMRYPEEMLDRTKLDRAIEERLMNRQIPHEQMMNIKNEANARLMKMWQDVYRNKRENYGNQ